MWSQLWSSYIGSRLSKELHTSCVSSCITSTLDKHHSTFQTVYPQFLHSVADTGWGRLAQRITFCQEQELHLENEVSPTVAQPPGTLFLPTSTTLLTPVHSENDSRMYFMIVLTTDYCWSSWTCRIAAPYKFHVDWLIDWLIVSCTCALGQHTAKRRRMCTKKILKSFKNWQNYGHDSLSPFFGPPCRNSRHQTWPRRRLLMSHFEHTGALFSRRLRLVIICRHDVIHKIGSAIIYEYFRNRILESYFLKSLSPSSRESNAPTCGRGCL